MRAGGRAHGVRAGSLGLCSGGLGGLEQVNLRTQRRKQQVRSAWRQQLGYVQAGISTILLSVWSQDGCPSSRHQVHT